MVFRLPKNYLKNLEDKNMMNIYINYFDRLGEKHRIKFFSNDFKTINSVNEEQENLKNKKW